MATKKTAKAVQEPGAQYKNPCDHKDCAFFGQCKYSEDGSFEVPEACRVCNLFVGINRYTPKDGE